MWDRDLEERERNPIDPDVHCDCTPLWEWADIGGLDAPPRFTEDQDELRRIIIEELGWWNPRPKLGPWPENRKLTHKFVIKTSVLNGLRSSPVMRCTV